MLEEISPRRGMFCLLRDENNFLALALLSGLFMWKIAHPTAPVEISIMPRTSSDTHITFNIPELLWSAVKGLPDKIIFFLFWIIKNWAFYIISDEQQQTIHTSEMHIGCRPLCLRLIQHSLTIQLNTYDDKIGISTISRMMNLAFGVACWRISLHQCREREPRSARCWKRNKRRRWESTPSASHSDSWSGIRRVGSMSPTQSVSGGWCDQPVILLHSPASSDPPRL